MILTIGKLVELEPEIRIVCGGVIKVFQKSYSS